MERDSQGIRGGRRVGLLLGVLAGAFVLGGIGAVEGLASGVRWALAWMGVAVVGTLVGEWIGGLE